MDLTKQINDLVLEISHQREQLEHDRRELALAYERLTLDDRVHAAERLGRREERDRVLRLIEIQLEQLRHGSFDSCLLRALARQIQEVPT